MTVCTYVILFVCISGLDILILPSFNDLVFSRKNFHVTTIHHSPSSICFIFPPVNHMKSQYLINVHLPSSIYTKSGNNVFIKTKWMWSLFSKQFRKRQVYKGKIILLSYRLSSFWEEQEIIDHDGVKRQKDKGNYREAPNLAKNCVIPATRPHSPTNGSKSHS